MRRDRWVLLGAPWDCSGEGRGEQEAPAALRRAGLAELVAVDLGDADTTIDSTARDPASGVRAPVATARAAAALAALVARALRETPERRPLVVGGDCSLLLGVVPALREVRGPLGLWCVDGHPDYLDGPGSDTGETADLELAMLTGAGPAPPLGPAPLLDPRDVVLLGHRTEGLDPASAAEVARLPPELLALDAGAVRADPHAAGRAAAAHLAGRDRPGWLHLDLDVLDETALPAVTYPQPGGPGWDQLGDLLRPLATGPALLGVSVADYRPDLDPDGAAARRVVELLDRTLP